MKKFTDFKESKKISYKENIENKISKILEKELNIKISGENAEKISNVDINIDGIENAINELKTIIENTKIQERKNTLNFVKANSFKNFNMKWLNEQIDNLNNINHLNEIFNSKKKGDEVVNRILE